MHRYFASAVGPRHRRRERADIRMRVEPAHAVDERVGVELDVGIEHEVVVGPGAVQHEVVRGAVADVRVAVQVDHVNARVGEARLAERGDLRSATARSSLLSISARCTVRSAPSSRAAPIASASLRSVRSRRRDVGPVRDDADLQRRRQHEGRSGDGSDRVREAAAGCARIWEVRRPVNVRPRVVDSTCLRRTRVDRHAVAMHAPSHAAAGARRLRDALLAHAGVRDDIARTTAEVLVDGDLLGHTTHGLALLPAYLGELDARHDGARPASPSRRCSATAPRRRGTGSACPGRG